MMAKGKKGGGKKGGGGGGDASADAGGDDADFVKVKVDTDVKGTDPKSIIASVVEKFEKTVESTKASLASIRTGRPSPNLLDRVLVDYYGTNTPIPNVATVNVVSATTITVEPFEADLLKEIEKAISMSDLGMTPNNDGKMVRLNVPPLNAETRQKYVKQAKASGEDGKVAARNVRRTGVDAIKKLEKDKKIGEDESKGLQDDIQKKTDKAVKDVCAPIQKHPLSLAPQTSVDSLTHWPGNPGQIRSNPNLSVRTQSDSLSLSLSLVNKHYLVLLFHCLAPLNNIGFSSGSCSNAACHDCAALIIIS
jgi:ribosome recycling factor